jgi:hypothetical protein
MADVVIVTPPTGNGSTSSPVVVNAGSVGPQGPAGPPGAAGATGGAFTFSQGTPATVWTITHNLGYNPAVTATDISGNGIFGDVKYTSTNSLTITFSGVIGGYAYMS